MISVPIYQRYFFSSATLAFHLSLLLMQWTRDMLDFEDRQTWLVGFVMYFIMKLKPGRFFSLCNVFFFLYDDHPSSIRLEIRIHSQPFVRVNKHASGKINRRRVSIMVLDTGIEPARAFPWRSKSYIALSFLWKSKAYSIGTGRKIEYLFPVQGTKKNANQ